MKLSDKQFLEKYKDIIKEEVNVKEIDFLSEEKEIVEIIKPIGKVVSQKFWKDTWDVIKYAKQWNLEKKGDIIEVYGDWKTRELQDWEYEIQYSWVDEKNMSVEGDVITRLELYIDEELEKEWVAREISRFLNQMRKDAEYNVEDRVDLYFQTSDSYLKSVITDFSGFLGNEALLKNIEEKSVDGTDIVQKFETESAQIELWLKNINNN